MNLGGQRGGGIGKELKREKNRILGLKYSV